MATKTDLIKALSDKLDYLSKEDAKIAIDSLLAYLKDELCRKSRIEIRGFGSLSMREKKFADKDKKYNTIYFRASQKIQDILGND